MKAPVRPLLYCALLLTAVFILASTAPAQAVVDQDPLVYWLVQRVHELITRVEALEAVYTGPGAPDVDNGRSCLLGQLNEYGSGTPLQNETILKFVGMFDAAPLEHHFVSVRVEKESGAVVLLHKARHEQGWAYVFEHWHGCQFEGSGPWRPAEG